MAMSVVMMTLMEYFNCKTFSISTGNVKTDPA